MTEPGRAGAGEGDAPAPAVGPRGSGGIVRLAVERPVTVSVGALLVVLFGGSSIFGLPIQLTPDVSEPVLSVTTQWPGAAPAEIEAQILEPQEEALKDVDGLVEMGGDASVGRGRLSLEFEVGTDIDQALVRVTNRLTQVSGYPEAASEPVVTTSDSTGPPIAVITIRSPTGESPAAHRTWVEQEILPELLRIPGVADIRHIGGRDTEVHVDFDPAAVAARGLTLARLASAVRAELRDVSGGDITMGKRRYLVRTPLVPADLEELERIVVGTDADGTPILLGDVAEVRVGLRKPAGVAFSDDRPSMVLLLTREAGTNVLEVTREVRAKVEELDRERFQPEGLRIEVISDQVGYITEALELVEQNLLLGAALAILVLFLFLRSLGASAIIAVSIPVCVFGTALGMSLLGRTVNVVSLAGVTFAVGMVLDNSIVSLESIDTWRRRTRTAKDAATFGVGEVWGAVLASTLTTGAVFLPIIAWEGEVGQLLRDVAVAVALSVGVSLLVSIWVIPSLAARLLHPRLDGAGGGALGRLGDRLRAGVGRVVGRLVRSPLASVLVVIAAIGASVGVSVALLPPVEYLPTGNRNLVFGIIVPPPGYAVEELERTGMQVQRQMAAHTGVVADGVPSIERSFFVGSPDRIFAGAVATDPAELQGMVGFIRRVQGSIPGVFGFANQASLFGGLGGGRSIEVDISGNDLDVLSGLAARMMGAIKEKIPEAQVRPVPSLDSGAPELSVVPRRDDVAALGVGGAEVGAMVDALVDGAIVGEVGPRGQPKIDVVLRASVDGREPVVDPLTLASAPVATSTGRVVPLGSLAEIRETIGPTVIRRIERRRALTLEVSPPDTVPMETAIRTIREDVVGALAAEGALPSDVRVDLSGTAGKLDVARERFLEILSLALLICFLLLAALFEDFLAPVAVLVSVPLAAAGGVLGLVAVDRFLAPQPLDLMTALGFLILIGVVVNNAILVVDGALARLREGARLAEALPEAVQARVRPIFMTTATSLAGLMPMVLFPGSGSELYRGVGAVVLGGLALSTLLTLFVVPCLFTLLWRLRGVR